MSSGTIYLFGVGTNSATINSENSTTELNGPHFSEFGRLQNFSRFRNSSTLRVS
jgi:hypothetical protein